MDTKVILTISKSKRIPQINELVQEFQSTKPNYNKTLLLFKEMFEDLVIEESNDSYFIDTKISCMEISELCDYIYDIEKIPEKPHQLKDLIQTCMALNTYPESKVTSPQELLDYVTILISRKNLVKINTMRDNILFLYKKGMPVDSICNLLSVPNTMVSRIIFLAEKVK